MSVDILLATFNGEKHLTEQLRSLFDQSCQTFNLLIRDDGSTDGTLGIIESFTRNYPGRISLFTDGLRLGPKASFSALMQLSTAPYAMFCDQDDIWMTEKIALSLKQMQKLEQNAPLNAPLLVHSDLIVMDEKGAVLSPSFWKYANLTPYTSVNRLLTQNVVTGCAVIMNRALCKLAAPVPDSAFMHDWWVALVASLRGQIAAIPEPTIYYRQHTQNAVGAKKFGSLKHIRERLFHLNQDDGVKRQQALHLLERYGSSLTQTEARMLNDYTSLKKQSWVASRQLIFKHQFFKCGLLRNMYAFFMKRQP